MAEKNDTERDLISSSSDESQSSLMREDDEELLEPLDTELSLKLLLLSGTGSLELEWNLQISEQLEICKIREKIENEENRCMKRVCELVMVTLE